MILTLSGVRYFWNFIILLPSYSSEVIILKKTIPLLLSCLLMLTIVACGQEQPIEEPEVTEDLPVAEPSPDLSDIDHEEEMTGDEEDHPWIDDDVQDFSYTYNESIVAALTPDDAYIHSDVESMLVLMSSMSLEEFIVFCLNAVDELGATTISIDDSRSGFWIFDGSMDEDMHLHIELRDDGDSVNMMVLY